MHDNSFYGNYLSMGGPLNFLRGGGWINIHNATFHSLIRLDYSFAT